MMNTVIVLRIIVNNITAITKPNVLLATFLSKHDEDRFCLTTLVIFKLTKNLKQHKKSCRDCYHADMEIP